MKRRTFLKGLLSIAPAALVTKYVSSEASLVKVAQASQPTLSSKGTVIHTGSFHKSLWPGIQSYYGQRYKDLRPILKLGSY
jgi:hypothetical protein